MHQNECEAVVTELIADLDIAPDQKDRLVKFLEDVPAAMREDGLQDILLSLLTRKTLEEAIEHYLHPDTHRDLFLDLLRDSKKPVLEARKWKLAIHR